MTPECRERLREVAEQRASRVVSIFTDPLHSEQANIEHLLEYNHLWSDAVNRADPAYFARMAEKQTPTYFYIGCSDSRVTFNEIVGLCPGEVFVHRNVGNVVSPSDLNMLSALQFSVDHLHIRHVIVAGHYGCGGVTAALEGKQLGLADHWINHVTDVKKNHIRRMEREIAPENHLSALCEFNVIAQVSHLIDTHIVQHLWEQQKSEEKKTGKPSSLKTVVIHGWMYGLSDGLVHPLVEIKKDSNSPAVLEAATESVYRRYAKNQKK